MKIKKIAPSAGALATVSNLTSDSQKDTYSCDYLNKRAVIVSSEEPTTDEEVWIQKGKNLYDKPNEIGRMSTSDGGNREDTAWVRTAGYIEVKPNTTYTNTAFPSFNQMVVFYYNNTNFLSYELKQLSNYGTFTTPSNCNQVRFSFDHSIDTQCVLLKGEGKATEYEPYIPKKIHTKTDNGYEEFYNEKPNDTGWVKLNNVVKYRRIGNVVTVAADSRGEQTLTKEDYTSVGTLPSNVKPSIQLDFPWTRIGEGDVGLTMIGTDGNIRLFSSSGTGYWGFTITYLVD